MKVRLTHAVFIAAIPVLFYITQTVQAAQIDKEPNPPAKPPQATPARAVAAEGNVPTLFDAATAARRDTDPDLNGSVKEVPPAADVKR